jgi:DNA gyrase/topoisomerase IV subunit B
MVQIKMDDAEQAKYYFDVLLGEDIVSRKDYVFSHADFENLED